MITSFFNGTFFDGEFFNAPAAAADRPRRGSGGVYIRDDDPAILALRDEELLTILAAIMPFVLQEQRQ